MGTLDSRQLESLLLPPPSLFPISLLPLLCRVVFKEQDGLSNCDHVLLVTMVGIWYKHRYYLWYKHTLCIDSIPSIDSYRYPHYSPMAARVINKDEKHD